MPIEFDPPRRVLPPMDGQGTGRHPPPAPWWDDISLPQRLQHPDKAHTPQTPDPIVVNPRPESSRVFSPSHEYGGAYGVDDDRPRLRPPYIPRTQVLEQTGQQELEYRGRPRNEKIFSERTEREKQYHGISRHEPSKAITGTRASQRGRFSMLSKPGTIGSSLSRSEDSFVSTISRDNTAGQDARKSRLLAEYGSRKTSKTRHGAGQVPSISTHEQTRSSRVTRADELDEALSESSSDDLYTDFSDDLSEEPLVARYYPDRPLGTHLSKVQIEEKIRRRAQRPAWKEARRTRNKQEEKES